MLFLNEVTHTRKQVVATHYLICGRWGEGGVWSISNETPFFPFALKVKGYSNHDDNEIIGRVMNIYKNITLVMLGLESQRCSTIYWWVGEGAGQGKEGVESSESIYLVAPPVGPV